MEPDSRSGGHLRTALRWSVSNRLVQYRRRPGAGRERAVVGQQACDRSHRRLATWCESDRGSRQELDRGRRRRFRVGRRARYSVRVRRPTDSVAVDRAVRSRDLWFAGRRSRPSSVRALCSAYDSVREVRADGECAAGGFGFRRGRFATDGAGFTRLQRRRCGRR